MTDRHAAPRALLPDLPVHLGGDRELGLPHAASELARLAGHVGHVRDRHVVRSAAREARR
jgi:hypothetical protein